eukprot:3882462-Alexandrium_andersonii.AAC.1
MIPQGPPAARRALLHNSACTSGRCEAGDGINLRAEPQPPSRAIAGPRRADMQAHAGGDGREPTKRAFARPEAAV